MCGLHVSFWSSIRPRYFTSFLTGSCVPFIVTSGQSVFRFVNVTCADLVSLTSVLINSYGGKNTPLYAVLLCFAISREVIPALNEDFTVCSGEGNFFPTVFPCQLSF